MRVRWWRVCGLLAVAGGAVGLAVSYSRTPVYVSEGVVRLDGREFEAPTAKFWTDVVQDVWLDMASRKNLAETIQRPNLNLYAAERERLPVEDLIDRMKEHDLSLEGTEPEVRVSFRYANPVKAQATVALFLEQIVAGLRKQGHQAALESGASLAGSPESPERRVFAGVGAGVGLLIGVLVSMFVWRPVWSAKVLACGLAGAAGLWAASLWFAPDRYESKAVLRAESRLRGGAATAEIAAWRRMIEEDVWELPQMSELSQRPTVKLFAPDRDDIAVLEAFRKAVRLECFGCDKTRRRGFASFKVAFEAHDAEKAQRVVSAVVTKIVDATMVESRRLAVQDAGVGVTLLDPANLPDEPESPRRWVLILAGFVGGLVFGAGWLR